MRRNIVNSMEALRSNSHRCNTARVVVEPAPQEIEVESRCVFSEMAFGCPCRLATQTGFFETLDRHDPLSEVLRSSLQYADTIAEQSHHNQERRFGRVPVITHPRGVTEILYVQAGIRDEVILAGAATHDVLEDDEHFGAHGFQSYHQWRRVAFMNARGLFQNSDLAKILLELVEPWIDGIKIHNEAQRFEQQRKQLWEAHLNKNERVSDGIKLIKLADRLHNFITMGPPAPLGPFSLDQQLAKCRDTEVLVLPMTELVSNQYKPAALLMAAQIQTYVSRIYDLAQDAMLNSAAQSEL